MRRYRSILAAVAAVSFAGIPTGTASAGGGSAHAAITITSNASFASCACVTSGSGTAGNPFVIGPWTIKSPSGGASGWSVKVDNSTGAVTAFFVIVGITSAYNDTNPSDPDIWLVDVNNPTTISSGRNGSTSTGANATGTGVRLDHSSHITLDGLSYNKSFGPGVYINASSSISIDNSKFKAVNDERPNGDGVFAVNSSSIRVGLSSTCPSNRACNDTTYDDGFAYDLVDTHDVIINRAIAQANDTGGYLLQGVNTYDVTIRNSTASGIGSICSKEDIGVKHNTGYVTDLQGGLMLVDGAHDNTFSNDSFQLSGSAPLPSIGSGGNGFYQDACAGWVSVPFSPVEASAGSGNTFSGVCYSLPTNFPGLPPTATCKGT
jgi:parallel beta helix pectate lyase-like protein